MSWVGVSAKKVPVVTAMWLNCQCLMCTNQASYPAKPKVVLHTTVLPDVLLVSLRLCRYCLLLLLLLLRLLNGQEELQGRREPWAQAPQLARCMTGGSSRHLWLAQISACMLHAGLPVKAALDALKTAQRLLSRRIRTRRGRTEPLCKPTLATWSSSPPHAALPRLPPPLHPRPSSRAPTGHHTTPSSPSTASTHLELRRQLGL